MTRCVINKLPVHLSDPREGQQGQASKLTSCKIDISLRMRKAPNLAALDWSLKSGLENKLSILEAPQVSSVYHSPTNNTPAPSRDTTSASFRSAHTKLSCPISQYVRNAAA